MTNIEKVTLIIAYIPVLHRGYLDFIRRHPEAKKVLVLDSEILQDFEWLRKDIRSLQPSEVVTGLFALLKKEGMSIGVELLNKEQREALSKTANLHLVMPDEDIMHTFAEQFSSHTDVTFDSVFLRWDSKKTLQEQPIVSDAEEDITKFQKKIMTQASELAEKSADWWRQVGAVILKDKEVILAGFNQHVPDQYQPLYNGDPRGNFKKGLHIELGTALHAEAGLIAEAARRGISLEETELYVTTFPCPSCAKLIGYSGIKKLYFQGGYSMVDGESILKEKGVKIIQLSALSSQV